MGFLHDSAINGGFWALKLIVFIKRNKPCGTFTVCPPPLGLVDKPCPNLISWVSTHVSHELTWRPSCRALFHLTFRCVVLISTLEVYAGEHALTATISSCGSALVTLPWMSWELDALGNVQKDRWCVIHHHTVHPQKALCA